MKLKIYNDLHYYGPHELDIQIDYSLSPYLLGDIVDLIYCTKKDLPKAKDLIKNIKTFIGDKYITGNHEGSKENLYKIIDNHILLIHGDLIMEDLSYIEEVRGDAPPRGSGFFTRFWIWLYEKLLPGQPYCLWSKKIKKAASYAKNLNCDTVIMGHNHPAKRYDRTIANVRIIGLKRGYNEVEI